MVKKARNWGIVEKRGKIFWAKGIYSEIKSWGANKGSINKNELRIIVENGTLLSSKIERIWAKFANTDLETLNWH